jgi:hypothetical protein
LDNGKQPSLRHATPPYGVLLLPSLVGGTAQPQDVMLPLTLTYLLSMHMAFYLPVSGASVALVEALFDQVLNDNILQSKGIVYRPAMEPAAIADLLEKATLMVTTNSGSRPGANLAALPQATVCFSNGKVQALDLRNTDRLSDPELKAKLVGCAQLINIQAGGFITQGPFSFSW